MGGDDPIVACSEVTGQCSRKGNLLKFACAHEISLAFCSIIPVGMVEKWNIDCYYSKEV